MMRLTSGMVVWIHDFVSLLNNSSTSSTSRTGWTNHLHSRSSRRSCHPRNRACPRQKRRTGVGEPRSRSFPMSHCTIDSSAMWEGVLRDCSLLSMLSTALSHLCAPRFIAGGVSHGPAPLPGAPIAFFPLPPCAGSTSHGGTGPCGGGFTNVRNLH